MSTFLEFINLHRGEENKSKTLENIQGAISFRGANLWILACAIMIASVGLNVNSAAVIIGAMLISPLMGPIVGAGFALGTYNFHLLKRSVKNLAIATGVGLFVSCVYFLITPFKETQSELLARTSPNIYDILIAFFGGLVGVIALTRSEKGNPIPGVAIATALMPPLCTAGYGLAIGNFAYFFGAVYLYTINCVFICIATFLIVKYLKYPVEERSNIRYEKWIRYGITGLIFIMLVPGIYFAYRLFREKKTAEKMEMFIQHEFTDKGYTVIYKKTELSGKPKILELAFLSKKFSDDELQQLNDKLKIYRLNDTELRIRQDTTDIKDAILNEIGYTDNLINEKDLIIQQLQNQLNADHYDNAGLLSEIKVLYPEIISISIANHSFYDNTDSSRMIPVLLYTTEKALTKEAESRLKEWLQVRMKKKEVRVYAEKIRKSAD